MLWAIDRMASEDEAGPERPENVAPRPLTRLELFAGVALPMVAIATQGLLLRDDMAGPWLTWSYAALGILALFAAARTRTSRRLDFIRGANLGAALGSIVSAALHGLLFSYHFGSPALVALIPVHLGAACVNARRAFPSRSRRASTRWRNLALAAMIALATPFSLQIAEARWITAEIVKLGSKDPKTVIAAVKGIKSYKLGLGRFAPDICLRVVRTSDAWRSDAELNNEIVELFGPYPTDCETHFRMGGR